jgi:hypothetical protein
MGRFKNDTNWGTSLSIRYKHFMLKSIVNFCHYTDQNASVFSALILSVVGYIGHLHFGSGLALRPEVIEPRTQ